MKIEVKNSYEKVSRRAAEIIAREIIIRRNPVLGLPTGDTPIGTYELLVSYYEKGLVDFSRVKTFNLDEYYPISENDPRSFAGYMDEKLFEKVNLAEDNTNLPDGTIPRCELEDHCEEYEKEIDAAGGIDLLVLGIGENGHIGFNEPGTDFGTETRLVKLAESTIRSNFEEPDKAPDHAITMGIKTIMQSSKILLLATGEEKRETVVRSLKGTVTNEWPASILQLHPHVICLFDRGAGGEF